MGFATKFAADVPTLIEVLATIATQSIIGATELRVGLIRTRGFKSSYTIWRCSHKICPV